MASIEIRAATALLAALCAPAGATAESGTAFDGYVVECVTGHDSDVFDGPQVTRYSFLGDGRVAVDIATGVLECQRAGRLEIFELGVETSYALRCAGTVDVEGGGEVEVDYFGAGAATLRVDGSTISGHDYVEYDVRFGDERYQYSYDSDMDIVCNGDVCAGGYFGHNERGEASAATLICERFPLGGS